MKMMSGVKSVLRRIVERVLGEWLSGLYFECRWSSRVDSWIEEVIYKLNDEWFVE